MDGKEEFCVDILKSRGKRFHRVSRTLDHPVIQKSIHCSSKGQTLEILNKPSRGKKSPASCNFTRLLVVRRILINIQENQSVVLYITEVCCSSKYLALTL